MANDREGIGYRETMWAELSPDIYGGPEADQVIHQWSTYAEGDMEGDTSALLELAPNTFPPGTKVIISEPACPDCQIGRQLKGEGWAPQCECGFDWDAWVEATYS